MSKTKDSMWKSGALNQTRELNFKLKSTGDYSVKAIVRITEKEIYLKRSLWIDMTYLSILIIAFNKTISDFTIFTELEGTIQAI